MIRWSTRARSDWFSVCIPSRLPERISVGIWCVFPSRMRLRTAPGAVIPSIPPAPPPRPPPPPLAGGGGRERLGQHALEHGGELGADLSLLVRGEDVDDAVHRGRRTLRVQGGGDEGAGVGRGGAGGGC